MAVTEQESRFLLRKTGRLTGWMSKYSLSNFVLRGLEEPSQSLVASLPQESGQDFSMADMIVLAGQPK